VLNRTKKGGVKVDTLPWGGKGKTSGKEGREREYLDSLISAKRGSRDKKKYVRQEGKNIRGGNSQVLREE